jgi:hypothetical protein
MKIKIKQLPREIYNFIVGSFFCGNSPDSGYYLEDGETEMEIERVITKLSQLPPPHNITNIAILYLSRIRKQKLQRDMNKGCAIVTYSQVPSDIREELEKWEGISVNLQGEVLVDDLVGWLEKRVAKPNQHKRVYTRLHVYLNQLDRIKYFNSLKGKTKKLKVETSHELLEG